MPKDIKVYNTPSPSHYKKEDKKSFSARKQLGQSFARKGQLYTEIDGQGWLQSKKGKGVAVSYSKTTPSSELKIIRYMEKIKNPSSGTKTELAQRKKAFSDYRKQTKK